MPEASVRVLLVDDLEPFRILVRSLVQEQSAFQVVGEASDGLAAVQQAKELQPDLVLLDIGLPELDGLGAADRIREVSPSSRIVFLTQYNSPEMVRAALDGKAYGYVLKTDIGELLAAMRAVLSGNRFVSASVSLQITEE